MDRQDGKRLSPEQGAARLMDIAGEVANVTAKGDFSGFDEIFRSMEEVVEATGTEIPGFADKLEVLRRQTEGQQARFEAYDDACWAGDFRRAQGLMDESGLDLGALLDLDGFEDFDEDEDEEGDTGAEKLGLGFASLSALPDGEGNSGLDLYADLARGEPGGAEALIAAGTDLNTPCGEAGHTALLAALDAPGRRAGTVAALIDAGADAKVIHGLMGDNVFSWSMGYDHPGTIDEDSELELFSVLVSEGADPDHLIPDQMSALHRGILQTSTPQVEALLTIGADPDRTLPDHFQPEKLAGATPLMLAAPKPDLVRRLLDHGADAAKPDAQGRSQLGYLEHEAASAAARVDPEDPWTADFARALAESVAMIRAHLEEAGAGAAP